MQRHRRPRHLVAPNSAAQNHLRRVRELEHRCQKQQRHGRCNHLRILRIKLRNLVVKHADAQGRDDGKGQARAQPGPGAVARRHRVARAQRLTHAREHAHAQAQRHHKHQRGKIERNLVRRNLRAAKAGHQKCNQRKGAGFGEIRHANGQPQIQQRAHRRPVRPLKAGQRISGPVRGAQTDPQQQATQIEPHAQQRRPGAAQAALRRKAAMSKD